ncbi:L,D-transpeptidase family protein [Microbacterium sp. H1-D42]|uniref:L,D-transpeptidase family protein n=1 Tax=Microbacterium sp. H1-D42 TaxID=2925844 RepID=UPI001F5321A4|nr:L,D-transpeptidase family protein [Microbacterium sp. H1-D42]UNK70013.1 L,D-transpeptidase/peptidoglycan binding protein [Microbacterium sp. H1-D42]
MTDLISGPDTGATQAIPTTASTAVQPPHDGEPAVQWGPSEPTPKKRRIGLWVGLGAGALLLAAAGASTILIAPGTTVAGASVGWMTPGMAADVISDRVATTEVELTGAGDDAQLQGADLGASVDAQALAEQAFADRPMWNLGAWMGEPVTATVVLDADAADRALRATVPTSFVDPTEATVVFDEATAKYVATPAESGTGISVDALTTAFNTAVSDGDATFTFSGDATDVAPQITDEKAAATVEQLNGMLATIGFYVGKERTVPVAPAVAASWLTVEAVDGELQVSADSTKIQTVVDSLAKAVDRAPVPATTIVDSGGQVLRTEAKGVTGRELGETSGVASDFAAGLEKGDAVFPLTVSETPFETTAVARSLTVDISDQRTYLVENGNVVRSWAVSTGLPGTATDLGHFRVRAHVPMQDMKGTNADGSKYVTKDVPWVTYFNGDEAFHGTYWHTNFGNRMSHGCVNMPIDVAKQVFDLAPSGLEVWVRQ